MIQFSKEYPLQIARVNSTHVGLENSSDVNGHLRHFRAR